MNLVLLLVAEHHFGDGDGFFEPEHKARQFAPIFAVVVGRNLAIVETDQWVREGRHLSLAVADGFDLVVSR